jgi:GNAT superfamily N-acetyltransferase
MAGSRVEEVRIRPGRPKDFAACAQVWSRSLRDLSRREGQPPPQLPPRNVIPFYRHALATDPDGFHVAVLRGKVICYAITILRGKTQFLAQFFALPGAQSRGVGRQVLTHAFESTAPPGGTVRCVVASLDLRAQALYAKFGMLARTILYYVASKPTSTRVAGVELRQVGPTGMSTKRAREMAARFDRPLREVRRDVDQRYFLTVVEGSRFYEARADGKLVGYVVIRGNGAIGPGGVNRPSLSGALMSAAIAKARDNGMKKVSAWIPGLNVGALTAAFAAGMKIEFLTAWMASADILRLDAYLPSGGVLF